MKNFDVIIIGAGASGLMCAIESGKRERAVLIIDHSKKIGQKILISGGGRCNFTNYELSSKNYISNNPHFCKSAISRYNQWDFLDLVYKYNIEFEEREHGRLFTLKSSKEILDMLLKESNDVDVEFQLETKITNIEKKGETFIISSKDKIYSSTSLVIATGGLSIKKIGASSFGYDIAEQFNINVVEQKAGLVPFITERFSELSGIAIEANVSIGKVNFRENILFTHKGISGPAILQISSYWKEGDSTIINLLPDINLLDELNKHIKNNNKKQLSTILSNYLPKRVVKVLLDENLLMKNLNIVSKKEINFICDSLHRLKFTPLVTEGYQKAEVTLGGVDCNELSSKTMESKKVKNLFFIGEVLDVTGWLGGYNLQWAWSSGWSAGQIC